MSKLAEIFQAHTIDGTDYLVSTGTGERGYGSDLGGSAAFAYLADDVEAWRENSADAADYSDFCEACSPEEDRDLAVALAAVAGLRLTRAGSCSPVLTDDEYRMVRRAVEVVS